ncbi:hypothetical protein [Micromonospora sp. NPDC007230]|uniref:hypothetical protein n=1 Tax=Micromonospora sp. NPDC007230 TaxID=3364237 RepID=UPI003677A88E
MRTKPRVLAALALAALAPLGALAAPAQAHTSAGKAAQSGQYCVVVLGKASSPGEVSPELYRHCSATPFDTKAHLRSGQAQKAYLARNADTVSTDSSPETLTAAAQVHLIRAWEDANYKGQYWDYYGGAACDQYGYRWDPDTWWRDHLSSIESGYNSKCTRARLHTWDLQKWGEFALSLSYVGSTYNDNVGRVQIWNG